jgi:tRNA U55 pseudouridine synthase TruB
MSDLSKIKKSKTIQELLEFGIININKPANPTSFDVSDFVRKKLDLKKTSHFGTLDPKVTGVLPIALNRACKLTGFFLGEDKEYIGIMRLHEEIEIKEIQKIIDEKFLGKIKQIPPKKSRVARVLREREIKSFELIEKKDKDILFRAEVQGGTYIRKLCLHPETEVLTINGLVKISDFYNNPSNVYSISKNSIVVKKPSAVQKIIAPSRMIKLITSSGMQLTLTPDHKMLISREGGYSFVEAENIKEGDYIVKNSKLPILNKNLAISDLLDDDFLVEQPEIKEICKEAFLRRFGSIRNMHRNLKLDRKVFLKKSDYAISIKHLKLAGVYDSVKDKVSIFKTQKGSIIKINNLTENHLYLLGLIASDGNNTREKKTIRHTRLKFHNKNEQLINKFMEIYLDLFPNIPISKKMFGKNLYELDTANSLFASIAANLGVKSPYKKTDLIPILYFPDNLIKSFLRGYFDGDGTSHFKKKPSAKGIYSKISFFSISSTNAKRIHQMLMKVGIRSKIFKLANGMNDVNITDLDSKHKFINEVGTNHPKKLVIFNKILNINNQKESSLEYIGLHYKRFIENNRKKLYGLGGNLSRILKGKMAITSSFYEKCQKYISLPALDSFTVEKISKIKYADGNDYVYDMTIPGTHNFLIETGYISSNCDDLGKELEIGAHMLELRRIRAGIFTEDEIFLASKKHKEDDKKYPSVNLYDFEKFVDEYKKGNEENLRKIIIPAEIVSEVYQEIQVKKESVKKLLTGKPIFREDLRKEIEIERGKIISVFANDKFIGMYEILNEKEIFAKAKFVLQPIV